MNNFDRRLWKDYMQKSNERNPNTVSTKMNSLAFNKKLLERKESADNKYNAIPNMTTALEKIRNDKRTLAQSFINATGSKIKTK